MASHYWIKLYHEILDDPKMGRMSDRLWRRTIELFLLAGEYGKGGRLPPTEDMAWRLRCNAVDLLGDLKRLCDTGLITNNNDQWTVPKFAHRQARQLSPGAIRQKQFRERLKAIWEPLPDSAGIYRLHYAPTDKSYIGGSRNIQSRVRAHISEIRGGIHCMSDDVKGHGYAGLTAEVLETVEPIRALAEREQYWLSTEMPEDLYNSESSAKSHRSWKRKEKETEEDTDTDTDIENNITRNVTHNNGITNYRHEHNEQDDAYHDMHAAIAGTVKDTYADYLNGEAFDAATRAMLDAQITVEQVTAFRAWWRDNGHYDGRPALKSLVQHIKASVDGAEPAPVDEDMFQL